MEIALKNEGGKDSGRLKQKPDEMCVFWLIKNLHVYSF